MILSSCPIGKTRTAAGLVGEMKTLKAWLEWRRDGDIQGQAG